MVEKYTYYVKSQSRIVLSLYTNRNALLHFPYWTLGAIACDYCTIIAIPVELLLYCPSCRIYPNSLCHRHAGLYWTMLLLAQVLVYLFFTNDLPRAKPSGIVDVVLVPALNARGLSWCVCRCRRNAAILLQLICPYPTPSLPTWYIVMDTRLWIWLGSVLRPAQASGLLGFRLLPFCFCREKFLTRRRFSLTN